MIDQVVSRNLHGIYSFALAFADGIGNDLVAASLAVRLRYDRCCSDVSRMILGLGIASTFEVSILNI